MRCVNLPAWLLLSIASQPALWSIDLAVPWSSQFYGPPGNLIIGSHDCGPTSTLMVMAYYNGSGSPTASNLDSVSQWLQTVYYAPPYSYRYNSGAGSNTVKEQLPTIAQEYTSGPQYNVFPNTTAENWAPPQDALAKANQELMLGHPLIVGVLTYMGTRLDKLAKHFMVLRGLDLTKGLAYFNDPGRSVANQQYAQDVAYPIGCATCPATFLHAWASQNYAVVIIRPAIIIQATLDGQPWLQGSGPGSLNYNTYGPANFIQVGSGVPRMVPAVAPGSYTVTYFSGGPPNSTLVALSPCTGPPNPSCTAVLGSGADQSLTFTFAFKTNPPVAGFTMSSGSQSANENQTLNLSVPVGGSASVTFNAATRSQAFNGATITGWQWTIDGTNASMFGSFTTSLAKGSHPVTLVVTDSLGNNSAPASGTISVSESSPSRYSVTDLGTLGGSAGWATASGINNQGQVVGTSWNDGYLGGTGGFYFLPLIYGFLWSGGTMTNLGVPAGVNAVNSSASGVNNTGQVVGSWSFPQYSSGSFYYSSAGGMTSITSGYATAINDSGLVVGADSTAYVYNSAIGQLSHLISLGGNSAQASAINASGQIAGSAYLSDNVTYHAVRWGSGTISDLGTLGGTTSQAYGINNSGQVVGASLTANFQGSHAFSYSSGKMADLGTLGGFASRADAVNNSVPAQIVGWANTVSGDQHAFLYSAGMMLDLNGLVTLGPAAFLVEATGINDIGQIAANGNNGHAYLVAIPSPLPGTIMLSSTGTVPAGQSALFPVSLSAPAPPGGVTLSLTSSDTSKLTVTPTLTIMAGAMAPVTQPQITGVNVGTATITVSGSGYVPVYQQVHSAGVVYSQTSYDPSVANFCLSYGNVGCPSIVSNWQQPTGNPPGKLGSITLKLQVQSASEYQAWYCPGSNCGWPGDYAGLTVWSTQTQSGCNSTTYLSAANYPPDTWQDFTFKFDSCPIDFSQGDQIYSITTTGSVLGWGIATTTSGQPYLIVQGW